MLIAVDPVNDLSDIIIAESTILQQLAEPIEEIIGQYLAALLETVVDDIVHVKPFSVWAH
jgi:hypothetical protein